MFQRSGLLQQLLCHVEACFEGARSYMHLFFFSRSVRGGDTDFLLIGIVFDATRFARPVFQCATRRNGHCLFVVAFHSWSCFCCRRVVAIVSELRQVYPQRGRSLSRFFHGGGQLGSRFTWVLRGIFLKALCIFQRFSF